MNTTHEDETSAMKPWGWMVQYGVGMLLALILAALLGSIPLFRQTALAGTGLKAAHLVQFVGYGGALLLCWLLGRCIAVDPPFTGAWVPCVRELVMPLTALIVSASAYPVALLILKPFFNATAKALYNWVFVLGITGVAIWLTAAWFVKAAPLVPSAQAAGSSKRVKKAA
jgi:hypothetical protein